ncbi:MAG: DUF4332 domain-containing protein [Verrucomicrobia bacterium]|nr:DUF4332 domain-containing protein [Verrucomicrobiota bacterium]
MGTTCQVKLDQITLKKLKMLLKKGRLLPSQQVLKEQLDERFSVLEKQGIRNVQQLQMALKAKKDVSAFAKETGIPDAFLTVLRREANSYTPKPRALKDFSVVDGRFISKLGKMGITDTVQYLEKTGTKKDRKLLADTIGAGIKDIEALTRLADLTRLRYVNAAFAALLVKAGYDSVQTVSKADPQKLYNDLVTINGGEKIFGGAIGLEDMKSCVLDAKEVPRPPVEY